MGDIKDDINNFEQFMNMVKQEFNNSSQSNSEFCKILSSAKYNHLLDYGKNIENFALLEPDQHVIQDILPNRKEIKEIIEYYLDRFNQLIHSDNISDKELKLIKDEFKILLNWNEILADEWIEW